MFKIVKQVSDYCFELKIVVIEPTLKEIISSCSLGLGYTAYGKYLGLVTSCVFFIRKQAP